MSRLDALRMLGDPDAVAELVASATYIYWDGTHAYTRPMADPDPLPLVDMHPVRRIGTYHGARSRFAFHPTRFGNHRHLVLTESLLESSWLQFFDRRPSHWGYLGQAVFVTWRLGSRQIVHIPDVVGQDADGRQWIADVRHSHGMDTSTGQIMDRLMRATCVAVDLDYAIYNDMEPQMRRNLEFLSTMRWRNLVVDTHWWPNVRKTRPERFIDLAAAAGEEAVGRRRALRVIAQCHVDVDLNQPINSSTRLTWRPTDA